MVTPGLPHAAWQKAREMVERHREEMVAAGLRPDQIAALDAVFTQAAQAMGAARMWARVIAGALGEELLTRQFAELSQIAGTVPCDCGDCTAARGKRS